MPRYVRRVTRLGPNHAVGVARAVTIGAAVGAAVSTTAQVYSACLDSLTLVAATAVLTTTFRPRPGAGWPGAPLLGAGAILAGAYLLPLVGWLTGPTALPWLAGAGLALAARALSAPPRGAPVNLAGPTAIIAVAVAVLTGASSPLPAVVVACVGQLFGWAMGRRAESISDGAPDVWTVGGTWRAVPAGVPVLAPLACGAWASTRNWDSGFVAALLAVGFGLGAATTGRKPTAGMGVLALLLLAGAASGLGPVPIAFAGVALLTGLLARVLGGSPPRVAAGALLFTGLLPLLAPLVPDARTRELAQVVAAPPAVTARLEAARGRAAPVAQGLGARGAWALSRDGDHLLQIGRAHV